MRAIQLFFLQTIIDIWNFCLVHKVAIGQLKIKLVHFINTYIVLEHSWKTFKD